MFLANLSAPSTQVRPLGDKRYKALSSDDRRDEFLSFVDERVEALRKKRPAAGDGDAANGAPPAKKAKENGTADTVD